MNNKIIVALVVGGVLIGTASVLLKVYDRKLKEETDDEIDQINKVFDEYAEESELLIHEYVESLEKRNNILDEFYENFQKLAPNERRRYLKVINGTI